MKLSHDVVYTQEIKKSRFICLLKRVSSEADFREFVRETRKLYPQATHYCTACKIGSIVRSNDDGEPSGTAGRPMLDVLNGSDVDEIGAVVVRYFGGTLLGKGGLVRAYASSVRNALAEADFLETLPMHFYQLRYDYDLVGKVDGFLRSRGIEKVSEDFGDEVSVCILCEEEIDGPLQAVTAGKIQTELLKDVLIEK